MAEAFFDSNVLLYLISGDAEKASLAEAALARGGHASVQVLNEFTNVARRKASLSWREVDDVLGLVRRVCEIHPLLLQTHDRARTIAERFGIAFYGALIVSSAELARCRVIYSEDFQDGQRFENGLVIRNPFR